MTSHLMTRIVLAGSLACCAASVAWAAPGTAPAPHASVPSVAVVGKAVTVSGGGFEPGEVVTLRIIGPTRRSDMAAVVASDTGSISHELVTASPGAYRIMVIKSTGKALPTELRLVVSQ